MRDKLLLAEGSGSNHGELSSHWLIDMNTLNLVTLARLYPGMYIMLKQRQFYTTEQIFILANNRLVLNMNINELLLANK